MLKMPQSPPPPNIENDNKPSKASRRPSYIRFKNTTERKVDVIWINYDGVRVKYKTLQPKEFFDVTSFVSHPWIFRDSDNHTKLICSSREIFDCPEPVYVKVNDGVRATRKLVNISLPLYSLHDCAMQAIQKMMKDPDDVYALEIPSSLQKELYDRVRFAI
ncbi:von Hippel-Lindau disease tumor suppressor [Folsomia candida]|uniref:von Hippel-Lindau disease tumor suppressor n=1 Tax=Folsomia candida TaxID=158441 RepID=A0A226ENF0_FOLCA|nr:von Hippel-Lindau disease tumor suppressor [Folsomia candida]OXA58667.1 Von Hippel-Lindau disease tumor suppressor [Folsomia candida]